MQQEAPEVMEKMQRVGVRAGYVRKGGDLLSDAHLKERGHIWESQHPFAGPMPVASVPICFSATPCQQGSVPADTYGRDNQYVYGELLGYSPEEIARLRENKTVP